MDSSGTQEVPREQWKAYFAQIEAQNRDKPVEVEWIGPEMGDQPFVPSALLRAISAVQKGTFAGSIEIDLGVNGGLDHRVIHPAHVYAIRDQSGQLECLDIEDESHTKTLVRFKEPLVLDAAVAAPKPVPTRDARVRQYMTSSPQTLTTGSSISEALELMQRYDFRHVPVLDSDGRLRGVLSDRDLYLAKNERGISAEDVTVEETMVRRPYTVSPDTRLDEAAAVMAERKYGCAVVVEEQRVVGILTTTDALRALI